MYKSNQHKDFFLNSEQAIRKRFNLVKKLSNDFTTPHKTAKELDELLMEYKHSESSSPSQAKISEPSKPSKVSQSPSKKETQNALVSEFETLFDLLKQTALAPSATLDEAHVQALIKKSLKSEKITFDDLDTDVQNRFSNLPITIRYELPDKTLPSFSKPAIHEFQQMVDDVLLGNNLFLVGGAGTGKTFTAENLIAKQALNRPHITINCSQWTSPTEIIGGQTMDGYVEGKLIEAWKNGWVLILDELPKIDPNTAGLFNDALSKTYQNDALIFNARKESFIKHPDFACIATGNIYPNKESLSYGANNKQDLSLLDRFSGAVYFVEKNPVIEKQILQNTMIWSICDKLRESIEQLKYEAQLSLRFMRTARDAYALEMKRLQSKTAKAIPANEGKTFKSATDSFLSTFTELQQQNLRENIRYDELFSRFQYRELPIDELVY